MKSYHARLSEKKRRMLFKAFVGDLLVQSVRPGTITASSFAKVHPDTAHLWYQYFRKKIFDEQMKLVHLSGAIEIDHHTFNARSKRRYRKEGELYRPLPTKSIVVLGILERSPDKQHRVYVQPVLKQDKKSTQAIVKHVVDPGSTLYSDMWAAFNDIGAEYAHKRVNHARKQFARKEGEELIHTATLDQFWQECEFRVRRFFGMTPNTARLHIAESAFRYNHRHDFEKALRAIIDP